MNELGTIACDTCGAWYTELNMPVHADVSGHPIVQQAVGQIGGNDAAG